ncbi:restriction endonuclease subunit S [Vibrio parahaemolyticus]|uniref:restriction endonuclease subunit S n=1 Tax=Vibrio parahaemolyticus TaxID=670 RepID=UPI0023625EFA|nr:restriction endonuclease subunit S [Vibrio parahaemolyticus]
MSKITNPTLVPELRFPEFINSWEIKHIGKVAENLDSKRKPITQQDRVSGSTPYYGASGIIDYVDGYIYDESLLCISEDGANLIARSYPIAFSIHGKTWVNNHAHVLKFKYSYTQTIVENYLNNISLEDYLTGMAQPKLNRAKLDIIPIPLPLDLKEQQKIAAFLSSMDDLITTNNKKLDSLKLHKKGLLQKLFPAEGKNIPELRFDGFEGEWEEVELRKLGDLISGLTYSPDDVRASGLLVLRSSNVQNGKIVYEDNVFVEPNIKGANISEPDDILICVRNGSKALIGKNALIPQNVPLSTHGAFMTMFRSKCAQFTFQLLQTDAYQKQVDADLGATINSINGKQLLKYKFKIPRSNDEKEMIVSCLSSLDDLINAQTDKIEVLKEYKKGLMQQLFPEIKETIA